jgi:adenylate cyclase
MTAEEQRSGEQTGASLGPQAGDSVEHGRHHAFPVKLPFFEEFKRRNLGRVAILYIVVCYLILEPYELFFHLLELPAWAGRGVVLLMALGFPAVLLFAWVYEVTPEGLKPAAQVHPSQSIARQTGQKLNRAIIAVLSLVLAFFVADKFWLSRQFSASETASIASGADSRATKNVAGNEAVGNLPAGDKSIAVLPFVDMSEKKDQEYFSDGLTEELIDHLTRAANLKVIARTSSFQFKGRNEDMRKIGKMLGVAHLLEGSVRKSGKLVRITVQLIRVEDGTHLWSQTYERNLSEIFKVQDEIATTVVNSLHGVLRNISQKALGMVNPEIQDLLLQGEHLAKIAKKPSVERAIQIYKTIISMEPRNADAWAGLASCYREMLGWGWQPPPEASHSLKEAALHALEIDPRNALAADNLFFVAIAYDWDWLAASDYIDRAIEIDPGNLWYRRAKAYLHEIRTGSLRDAENSVDLLRQSASRDPLNGWIHTEIARSLYYLGRYQESLEEANAAASLNEASTDNRTIRVQSLLQLQRFQEAIDLALGAESEAERVLLLAEAYWRSGNKKAADEMLRQMESRFVDDPMDIAALHAMRNELDSAFHWLDVAYLQRVPNLRDLRVDPAWRILQSDARYQSLLQKLNLTDRHAAANQAG